MPLLKKVHMDDYESGKKKKEGRLAKPGSVTANKQKGDVIVFQNWAKIIEWEIEATHVYDCVSDMLHQNNYRDFTPREQSANDALVVYYLLYDKEADRSDDTLYEDAIAWDEYIRNSEYKVYAWTGRHVRTRLPAVTIHSFF